MICQVTFRQVILSNKVVLVKALDEVLLVVEGLEQDTHREESNGLLTTIKRIVTTAVLNSDTAMIVQDNLTLTVKVIKLKDITIMATTIPIIIHMDHHLLSTTHTDRFV